MSHRALKVTVGILAFMERVREALQVLIEE